MKVLFRKSNGRVLGAQALGEDNVDKRISALAMAIQMGATVYDLEEAELCYAPQFGSAKDPVNFAGMVAAERAGRRHAAQSTGITPRTGFLLDVREAPETRRSKGARSAVNIPLGAAPRAPRRTAARQRDPRGLPLRPALLYRHAHSPAARVQGEERLGRRALAGDEVIKHFGLAAAKVPPHLVLLPEGRRNA